jgi:hypothetical protein
MGSTSHREGYLRTVNFLKHRDPSIRILPLVLENHIIPPDIDGEEIEFLILAALNIDYNRVKPVCVSEQRIDHASI